MKGKVQHALCLLFFSKKAIFDQTFVYERPLSIFAEKVVSYEL